MFDGYRFLVEPTDVVVCGSTIRAVGAGLAGSPEFAHASVEDAAGKTILPGLIDAHVHLNTIRGGMARTIAEPFSKQYYDSVYNARVTLEHSFTTVRDANRADAGLRQAIETGTIPGPHVKLSISMMSQTGGHGDATLLSGGMLPIGMASPGRPSGVADGVEECQKVARTLLRAGADQIKIAASGGVLSQADNPQWPQFTIEEIRAIVHEAEAQDTYVMAHAIGKRGIMNALHGGVRSIEHGIYVDDEAIEILVDTQRFLVPTLIATHFILRDAQNGLPVSPWAIEKAKKFIDIHQANIAHAIASGVRIVFGTDSGVGAHGQNLGEFELLADAGMGLPEVLRTATSNAAELLQISESKGRIAPEYTADLLVLDEELTSASQLGAIGGRIDSVWQDGRKVVQGGHVIL